MKAMVAAYMQRDAATFTVGTTDLLSAAINGARKWAELERNFELNRVQAQLSVSLQNGSDISNMKLLDGSTAVDAKSLIKGFLPMPDNANGWFPIDVIMRDKHIEQVQRHYETVTNLATVTQRQPSLVPFFRIVRLGNTVYLTPADTSALGGSDPITVRFDIIKFLPDYSADADTDFLLQRCENFMLLRSAYQLNFFLKDDQRINISEAVLNSAWHSVVVWDSTLVTSNSADADLD
jgi:hypothetical protein